MVLSLQSVRAAQAARFVLEGVPPVGFYHGGMHCPENMPFPACLRATLDYLGQDLGSRLICAHGTIWGLDNTYTYLMGASGIAFSLAWHGGWRGRSQDPRLMSEDPRAPFTRALRAAGYTMEWVERQTEDFFPAIRRSLLERGCPAIALGVIGPPEACLVTGFDDDGEVLVGWNFFQDSPEFNTSTYRETCGYFRKSGWRENTEALLLIGDRLPIRSTLETDRSSLQWALAVMRVAGSGLQPHSDFLRGQAAYRAWSAQLCIDDDFLPGDLASLRGRLVAHNEATGAIAEGRWYAARFMELLVERYPNLEDDLLSAAACFDAEHDLMWQAWGVLGGSGCSDEHARCLAEPAIRYRLSAIVDQARKMDANAADWIDRALLKIED